MKKTFITLLLTLFIVSTAAEAQLKLRQSTSRVVRVCGFVDVGDGFTPETGVTLGAADQAEALRDNTATLDISGATWTAVTGADGCYSLTLSTTATSTVGELVLVFQDSSVFLPVQKSFQVVEENVYDALYAASADLDVNLEDGAITDAVIASNAITAPKIATDAITAAKIAANALGASELATDAVTEIGGEVATRLNTYDAPTNAEMEARTLLATDYFNPATDTVANVTTVGSVSGSVGSISGITFPTNFEDLAIVNTAGTVTVGTNNDKSGYALAQPFPANFGDLAITATTGLVTVGTNNDKTGYSLTQTFPTNFADLDIEPSTGHIDVGFWNGTEITTALETGADIRDLVLNADMTNHQTAGTLGAAIGDGDAGAGMTEAGGTGDHLTTLALSAAGRDAIVDRPLAVDLACEVNTANFAGSTTTVACILTDRDGGAVTQASNDLEGKLFEVTSGAQIREARYIRDSVWDGANSELQITFDRPFPATLADAVTATIT